MEIIIHDKTAELKAMSQEGFHDGLRLSDSRGGDQASTLKSDTKAPKQISAPYLLAPEKYEVLNLQQNYPKLFIISEQRSAKREILVYFFSDTWGLSATK